MRLSDLSASVAPVEKTIPFALDGGVADRIRALVEESTQAEIAGDAKRAEKLLKEISEVGKSTKVIPFKFRQMDPEEFADTLDKCPPSEEQREQGLSFDDRKIRPIVVKASLVDPEPDEFEDFWSKLNWGQRQTLFDTAWSVNAEAVDIPFVQAASEITRFSKPTSTTADQKESPAPSSGAGKSAKSRRTTTPKAKSPAAQ